MPEQKEKKTSSTLILIIVTATIGIAIVAGFNVVNYFSKQYKTTLTIQDLIKQFTPADTSGISPSDTLLLNNIKYPLEIVVKTEDGDSTGALINVNKNGVRAEMNITQTKHSMIDLDFNTIYVLSFSKQGFITKSIYFETYVPKGREDEEFNRFVLEINLIKKTKKSVDDGLNLVGGVKYDSIEDDFEDVSK